MRLGLSKQRRKKNEQSMKPQKEQLHLDLVSKDENSGEYKSIIYSISCVSKYGSITKVLTEETLKELYYDQKKSLQDIAKEFNCSRSHISGIMKRYGLDRRTQSKARIEAIKKGKFERFEYYDINEDFFSKWSPEMAWVLGLLFTDGNVRPNRILFCSIDIELLEKIKKLLNSSNPIYKQAQSYDKSKWIYRFDFYREKMMEDFGKLGLHQRKSLNMIFPDVPAEYMRHFIRGCWDGDGSVYVSEGKLNANYVSGSLNFIERLVRELHEAGIHIKRFLFDKTDASLIRSYSPVGRYPLIIHKEKRSKAYYIKLDTTENLGKLFHYFYDGVDESIYLIRKYEVFVKGLRKMLTKKRRTINP